MASLDTSKTWIPYMNRKDCSQGFCSLYCPQWCYIIFPPPPPPFDDFSDDNSGSTFSPLIIAIIGILASALILVSYYTIISKYCWSNSNIDPARRRRRRTENNDQDERNQEFDHQENYDQDRDPSLHEPWNVSTTGLDEALIKKITMCKYKKGDGLIEGTDCSVCLSEFQENESIRLLPKCSHAFHVSCIDTWLQSHSNCPLCRSNILFVTSSLPPPPPPPPPLLEAQDSDSEQDIIVQNNDPAAPRTPVRVLSDLGNMEKRDTIIEIRDIERLEHVRRSYSMDRVSIADMLRINQEQDCLSEEAAGSSSKQFSSAQVKCGSSHRSRRMKRSFSSGRFFISKRGRVRDTILSPV